HTEASIYEIESIKKVMYSILKSNQAKQLYQELIKPHVLQSYSKALSLSPTLSKISKPQHWLSAVKK
ncbi:hypothetical protein, partial [Acinetobacter sp. OIFC021]|uniref:hypothetical protein n=1 Tax=Acinetobacter sp. OIFC021 TaxID=903928 RepID=UPI001BB1A3B0